MNNKYTFGNESTIEFETDSGEYKASLETASIGYDDDVDKKETVGSAIPDNKEINTETVTMSFGYDDQSAKIAGLKQISGVGYWKAKALYLAGYEFVEDVQNASQSELSEVEGIGNALAARIKADVGGVGIDADEIVDELEENTPSFLEENTLMVNIHE